MFEGIDAFRDHWYWAHLSAMGEESLSKWAQERNVEETYRFTYLPTFDSPLTVRIWSAPNQEPPIQAVIKLGGGRGGYEPGGLQKQASWTLSPEDRSELLISIEQNGFWTASSWERKRVVARKVIVLDGETWIFEGYRTGQYKILTSRNSCNGPAYTLGKFFSKLIPDGFGSFKDNCAARGIETLAHSFEAVQTLENVLVKAYKLRNIACEYAAAGEYDQALEIAQSIELAEPKATVLLYIGDEYAAEGQLEKADEIWAQALQVIQTLEDGYDKTPVLEGIAIQYAELGRLDQALQIALTLDNDNSVLAAIVVKLAAAGREDEAIEIANTFEYALTKARTLSDLAVKLVEAGQTQKADRIFTQSIQIAIAGTFEYAITKARVLAEIAVKIANAGQTEKAGWVFTQSVQVAQTLDYATGQVLFEISVQAATVGRYNHAIQIAQSIEDDRMKAKALAEIARITLATETDKHKWIG